MTAARIRAQPTTHTIPDAQQQAQQCDGFEAGLVSAGPSGGSPSDPALSRTDTNPETIPQSKPSSHGKQRAQPANQTRRKPAKRLTLSDFLVHTPPNHTGRGTRHPRCARGGCARACFAVAPHAVRNWGLVTKGARGRQNPPIAPLLPNCIPPPHTTTPPLHRGRRDAGNGGDPGVTSARRAPSPTRGGRTARGW